MQDLNDKLTGQSLQASEWNQVPSEIQAVIESLGIALSGADLAQLAKAIAGYVANGTFYTDSGVADAYVLTTIGLKKSPTAYTDGFTAVFRPGNANTGACTVNVAGLGVKSIKTSSGVDPAASTLLASKLVTLSYDLANDWFEIVVPQILITDKIQPISASVGASALTITLNPTTLDFRSSVLGSGAVNTRDLVSPISVVVSAGSTLGTVNGVQNRLAVLAIDNSGTVELAVVNMAGGNNLDETTLITTVAEGGAGAADSASVIYSTSARANVPFRVVGFVESTQATAGTWDTAPSTIQGIGGNALTSLQSIGFGQTYQNLTGSRSVGTTYYNTAGKPILIEFRGANSTTAAGTANAFVGGVQVAGGWMMNNSGVSGGGVAFIVPPGQSYSVTATWSTGTPSYTWFELR